METSSTQLIYTAVYVFIFIAAITISIYLFSAVTNFTEKAYEFGNIKEEGAVTLDTPTNRYRILDSNEVISYCYNYIIRDQYGAIGKDEQEANKKYNVNVFNDKGQVNISKDTDLDTLVKKLGTNKSYIFIYDSMSSDIANITIRPATIEETQAEF